MIFAENKPAIYLSLSCFLRGEQPIANKLLKQGFGLVKNECMFDRNYFKKVA